MRGKKRAVREKSTEWSTKKQNEKKRKGKGDVDAYSKHAYSLTVNKHPPIHPHHFLLLLDGQ